MTIEAKIIADSISPSGKRITTMVLRYPRFIHSEFMTHRVFSRNASSSRAIPVKKMLEQIKQDPAMPIHWGKNQPGMQANEELAGEDLDAVKTYWLEARDEAVRHVTWMVDRGLHKQVANRILEPWMHITVVVTATEWENFYALRCHPDAQPEMKALAEAMFQAHVQSKPEVIFASDWHLPFVGPDEIGSGAYSYDTLKKLSVARCARVSYLNHDGTNPDPHKDLALHDKLLASGHMSPFEHQAAPMNDPLAWSGNYRGWVQYRKTIVGESREYPNLTST